MRVGSRFDRAGVVIDCTPSGVGTQNKSEFYDKYTTNTAGFIARHTQVADRQRLLRLLGEGFSIDQALHDVLGLDTQALDRAVQEDIRSEFPDWSVPASSESEAPPPMASEASPQAS